MKTDSYYRDLDIAYSARLERQDTAREELERFRDKYRDEPSHDPDAGLCRCGAYSQPHDHDWTGDDPEESADERCLAGMHEYGPYTYTRVDFTRYWVCDCCGHELEEEADP